VDHARARRRLERSPPGERVGIEDVESVFGERSVDLLALDEALSELARFDPTMARVVDMHFFAGLPFEEIAEAVGIPLRTLQRRWDETKTWLRSRIAD